MLNVPAGVIQSRNPQLTLAEAQRQVAAYRAFTKARKRCIILDASKPLTCITEDAYAAIVDALAARTEKVLKSRFQ
jgi:hypothetical protein